MARGLNISERFAQLGARAGGGCLIFGRVEQVGDEPACAQATCLEIAEEVHAAYHARPRERVRPLDQGSMALGNHFRQ